VKLSALKDMGSHLNEMVLEIDVLPDFPKSKAELMRAIIKRIMAHEIRQHPLLAQIKTFTQHEGNTITYDQIGYGSKSQEAEQKAIKVDIQLDEIPTLLGDELDKKLIQLADQSGTLKMKSLFAKIEEDATQTGQKLDAAGNPLDGRMLLDLIDMVEGGFDSSGKPTGSFVVHPNILPAMKKASEEVENDPELKRRLESINSRQFQQWLDRENCRKLVD
jgi:hypothetical protein